MSSRLIIRLNHWVIIQWFPSYLLMLSLIANYYKNPNERRDLNHNRDWLGIHRFSAIPFMSSNLCPSHPIPSIPLTTETSKIVIHFDQNFLSIIKVKVINEKVIYVCNTCSYGRLSAFILISDMIWFVSAISVTENIRFVAAVQTIWCDTTLKFRPKGEDYWYPESWHWNWSRIEIGIVFWPFRQNVN